MALFLGVILLTASIFFVAKIVVRIITGSRNKDSCRDLFGKLNIHNLQS
jgi:hypothetical protein